VYVCVCMCVRMLNKVSVCMCSSKFCVYVCVHVRLPCTRRFRVQGLASSGAGIGFKPRVLGVGT